jgi:hypothetical protein
MIKVESECLKDTIKCMAKNIQGLETSIMEGRVSESYMCGNDVCPMTCVLTVIVEDGIITKVKTAYQGGNCVVNS